MKKMNIIWFLNLLMCCGAVNGQTRLQDLLDSLNLRKTNDIGKLLPFSSIHEMDSNLYVLDNDTSLRFFQVYKTDSTYAMVGLSEKSNCHGNKKLILVRQDLFVVLDLNNFGSYQKFFKKISKMTAYLTIGKKEFSEDISIIV